MLNLKSIIEQNEVEMGDQAAKDLFDDRLIVLLDPGCENLVGATFATGRFNDQSFEGEFKRRKFSGREFRRAAGVDVHTDEAGKRVNAGNVARLSHDHARTLDPEAYKKHCDTFAEVEEEMLAHNSSRKERRALAKTKRKQQRFWSNMVNWILAFADDMCPNSEKAPIILFGK